MFSAKKGQVQLIGQPKLFIAPLNWRVRLYLHSGTTPIAGLLNSNVLRHMKITWQDLTVDLSGQSSDVLMNEWRWLVPQVLSLRMVSALGDAFLADASGAIYWLDVGAADLICIADSRENFDNSRQKVELANQWFAPHLVGDLLAIGHILEAGQCFSCKIPLTLGGILHPDNFSPCDLKAHFDGLGKIQSQVKSLPIGTLISSVKLGE
ncbi:T6SS immunity protein Tdi1 domain-containing protein [Xanthomonas arboricola]|uniref:T6SS immunity protein Tdi1 domain-containing protein n=1 Tax=Xanthomonas arboricola TaxID=56448 RepID=UPI000CEDC8F2|nr:T6SS immunity protein Tdi1 domain-containing protein [Xanthomonas arboricola]PPU37316.1 hypothetical protein XaplCFBP3123_20635 [Xanthomonas arboricola pv. populi]